MRCVHHVHIACISRDGVQLLSSAERQKRAREEAAASASSDQKRGPFVIFAVNHEHGEYGTETYNTADELTAACTQELKELEVDTGQAEDDDPEEVDMLSLDELVVRVLTETRRAEQQRYNWGEVVEGGRLMRSE